MKNKHLVLLFLLTLLIGLSIRQAPWRNATFFQTTLLKLDTATIQQIKITLPAQSPVVFQRGDHGWSAEQEERSVNIPAEKAQEMLQALASMHSIRIVKTRRPDTLGFSPASSIQVAVSDNTHAEQFEIGLESLENAEPSSFVHLPKHEGIYLVNNHLRQVFSKTIKDFRDKKIASFNPVEVCSFQIYRSQLDTLIASKTNGEEGWIRANDTQKLDPITIEKWLSGVGGLRNLIFADLFDESHAQENYYAQIRLEFEGGQLPLVLNIYKIQRTYVPEDLSGRKLDRRQLAPYVIHSSQNPTNYFAFSDTLLLKSLCQPF